MANKRIRKVKHFSEGIFPNDRKMHENVKRLSRKRNILQLLSLIDVYVRLR